jgi:hypothetical protein
VRLKRQIWNGEKQKAKINWTHIVFDRDDISSSQSQLFIIFRLVIVNCHNLNQTINSLSIFSSLFHLSWWQTFHRFAGKHFSGQKRTKHRQQTCHNSNLRKCQNEKNKPHSTIRCLDPKRRVFLLLLLPSSKRAKRRQIVADLRRSHHVLLFQLVLEQEQNTEKIEPLLLVLSLATT